LTSSTLWDESCSLSDKQEATITYPPDAPQEPSLETVYLSGWQGLGPEKYRRISFCFQEDDADFEITLRKGMSLRQLAESFLRAAAILETGPPH
jgi:hypothetical protein